MPSRPVRGSGPVAVREVHPGAERLGRPDAVGEAQLVEQRGDRAAARGVGLRPGVEPQARDRVPGDRPAEGVALLQHERPQALAGQLAGGDEPRDPAADDDRVPGHRQISWTSRATRVSTVGSVSGGTP